MHTGVISTQSSEHNVISTRDQGYGEHMKTSHRTHNVYEMCECIVRDQKDDVSMHVQIKGVCE